MATATATDDVKLESGKTPQEPESSNKESEKKSTENSIYARKLPNRLVIINNSRRRYGRLNYFVKRAHKILRSDETLTITGVDREISMTCELVEFLKRQKIAKVTKIATNMNLNPNFAKYNNTLAWGKPTPTIVFHLERGEHATYVGDYQQKKVIELFEKNDAANSGKIDKKIIEKLNLPAVFLATEEQKEEAKKFFQGATEFDLPHFIRYCSILIHPLLEDSVFVEKLRLLGVGAQENNTETPQQ